MSRAASARWFAEEFPEFSASLPAATPEGCHGRFHTQPGMRGTLCGMEVSRRVHTLCSRTRNDPAEVYCLIELPAKLATKPPCRNLRKK
jgi:hypothetical protein